jgi:hypothetical protein
MVGRRGLRNGRMPEWWAYLPPFFRLHGAHAVTMFSQVVRPPFERGNR